MFCKINIFKNCLNFVGHIYFVDTIKLTFYIYQVILPLSIAVRRKKKFLHRLLKFEHVVLIKFNNITYLKCLTKKTYHIY